MDNRTAPLSTRPRFLPPRTRRYLGPEFYSEVEVCKVLFLSCGLYGVRLLLC
jgi:hypothetical protein